MRATWMEGQPGIRLLHPGLLLARPELSAVGQRGGFQRIIAQRFLSTGALNQVYSRTT